MGLGNYVLTAISKTNTKKKQSKQLKNKSLMLTIMKILIE